jgi:N-acetylglucosamine kinase-like BadF-type ATPase
MGTSAAANLSTLYQKGTDYIASFSQCVTEAANSGDKVACNILERNMKRVAEVLNSAALYVDTKKLKLPLQVD